MQKNILTLATASLILLGLAAPAFADTATSTKAAPKVNIACVGAAVAKRETAIDSAATTMTTAVNAAYTARASALASAYQGTDLKTIRAAARVAWKNFASSTRSARSAFNKTRLAAWSQYRSDAKACKGGAAATDSDNAGSELTL